MPVVRPYNLPEQEARAIPAAYPQTPAAGDLATFGGNAARDLQQAGANLERTGDTVFGIYERVAREANDTKIDADMNTFIESKQKALVGFSQLKGQDAIAGAEAVTKSLIEQKKALLEGAKNDYQRNALSRRMDAHLLDATGSVTQHVAREAHTMRVATTKAEANLIDREAFIRQDDPKAIEALLGVKAANANKQAAEAGHGPDTPVARELVAREQSELLTTIVQAKIVTGDPSALAFYDKYKDRIDPAKRPALDNSIKTMRSDIEARAWVRSNSGATDYDTRTSGYEGGTRNGGMVPNAMGSGAYGPFQFMPGTWADIRKAHPDLNLPADITQATEAQHKAAHGAFKADNAATLQKAGYEPTPANLYLAHRFGAKGAEAVLKANPATPLDKVLPASWFDKNPDMRGQTAGSFVQLAQQRMAGVTTTGLKPTTGDPALDAVNAATGMGATTQAPVAGSSDGIVNAGRLMVEIERNREALIAKANAEITNLDDRRATLNAIEADFTRRKAGVQLYKDELYVSVQDWMTRGGPDGRGNPRGGPALEVPPANIMSQLTWEQQQSIERQVRRNVEGKKPVTNRNVWYELHKGLTSANANEREMWAAAPLTQYSEFLSESDFQELARLQAEARKGGGKHLSRVQSNNALVDQTLLIMKIDPTPKPGSDDATKAATFHRVFREELTLFEAQKGKEATEKEAQTILDGMVRKVTTEGWLINSETPAALLTIANVPPADYTQIVSAIRASGGIPTEQRILQVYRHGLITQPTETEIPRPLEPPMLGFEPGGTATPPARPPAFPPSVLRVPAAPRVIDNPEPQPPEILGQTPMPSPTERLRRLALPLATVPSP